MRADAEVAALFPLSKTLSVIDHLWVPMLPLLWQVEVLCERLILSLLKIALQQGIFAAHLT